VKHTSSKALGKGAPTETNRGYEHGGKPPWGITNNLTGTELFRMTRTEALSRRLSARNQTEAALLQEHNTTRNILQTVEAIILAFDPIGSITMINRKGCDRVRLAQVLFNLLDNAVKYTPEGGCIPLTADVAGDNVETRLNDNGVGISDVLQPRIFDLFQQGERKLDRAQGGQGIGLTLAKQLVEMHGGQIEVTSAGPGLGSEFTIRLPALVEVSKAAGGVAAKVSLAAPSCRVLVVDDDPAMAESMAAMLQIEGHAVRTAANGVAALALALEFNPRLVLLDIGLGGIDGYEVARRLRAQQSADEKLCLVAVTGYGHDEARTRTREAGFDLHLVKPVFPETIFELLGEISRQQPGTSR